MTYSTTTITSGSHTTTVAYGSFTNSAGSVEMYKAYSYYAYMPSLGGAVAFAILFGLTFIALVVQIGWYCRKRKAMEREAAFKQPSDVRSLVLDKENVFESDGKGTATTIKPIEPCSNLRLVTKFIPLLIGILAECGGYIARIASRSDVYSLGSYVAQTVMLLVAAAFMAATIYMNFGRLMILLNATQVSFVPIKFSTTIFVAGDVLSILLQGAGGGILGSSDNHELGSNIIIAGLVVQVIIFGLFVITELRFLFLADKVSRITPYISRHWKVLNINLFMCSILILVRSIVRLVEFIQGYSGYIIEHEWFIFVFDAVPMFLVTLLFVATFAKGNLFKVETECTSLTQKQSDNGL
ncbi:LADA_0B01486g1_1 [Lachancea dasiensis]|uniref:LADA_0B01486g1_1 n=1 Tax=Lachancea dasiensis TaxID=1072105 RepID=A0A1G4IRY5_9SACH|nr:LADA_0B01486g1_1 [Lachancea dasiensis]